MDNSWIKKIIMNMDHSCFVWKDFMQNTKNSCQGNTITLSEVVNTEFHNFNLNQFVHKLLVWFWLSLEITFN